MKTTKPVVAKAIISGKTYEGEGKTVLEALENIRVPGLPRAKLILTVNQGGIHRTRIFQPTIAQRLFSPSPFVRQVALKNTATLFAL